MIHASTSNLSHEERERFAYFSGDASALLLAELADMGDVHELVSDIGTRVDEALAQLPGEDFFDGVLDDLQALRKTMRKSAARGELDSIIVRFEQRQAALRQDCEALGNELAKVRDMCEGRAS